MMLRHCLLFLVLVGVGEVLGGRGGGFRTGGRGGGWGSSSSSSRGGWFSRGSSSRSAQTRTSGNGGWASRNTNTGTGSSSYPKQQYGSSSSSLSRSSSSSSLGGSRNSIGGGGFVNPRKPAYSTNPYGTKQYSGYNTPRSYTGGVYGSGSNSYGYRTPGYGTSWGTNFAGGAGRYSKGYSGKALGMGVAAGFVGGAALGAVGTMAMYSTYHRYNMYRQMMYMNNPHMYGYNAGYYNNYYNRNICRDGCPMNAHCEWGFCECNAGSTRRNGQCMDSVQASKLPARPKDFNPFITCGETEACQKLDMNLICNKNLTVQGDTGKCECRQDMRWNEQSGECQLYLDVDCSEITYESKPSQTVLDAVDRAKKELIGADENGPILNVTGRTETANESLSNSLLTMIEPKNATAEEIKEAFCRDIDSLAFEMEAEKQVADVAVVDERPSPSCSHVQRSACAIAYDSSTCSGGWKLHIPEGQIRFRWFTSTFSYRNDMDAIGVKAGCTAYLYTDSDFTGHKVRIDAYPDAERWIVFSETAGYTHMDEDVEAVQCYCNQ